jgi:mannosyl-oligosaccharide alpha-1,2-mannosidase
MRHRRYRVFLAFAVIVVIALYKFGGDSASWRDAASSAAGLKSDAGDAPEVDTKPRPAVAHETMSLKLDIPVASSPQALQTPPPVKEPSSSPSPSSAATEQQKPTIPTPIQPHPPHGNPVLGDNALDSSTSVEAIHWTKLPEHFPVASESLIHLPSGKPKPIPQIQAKFKPEDAATKVDRLAKLDRIRTVAKKSWHGYKQYAWLHDELRPQSGTFKDPFAHWGATLVDALDTLWIMGLKDEFAEAVKAVDDIDFTTTMRADIPLFETTIRYLGGLLSAYDLSEMKHKNLLDKAVELAEILISAFDTPNRMPETYYYWRPDFASQRHRASQRVVLAEIGSLSLEFTRLAQLTGEHKYYDAIARITDELEGFQKNTKLPGMWPTYLDASGCGHIYIDLPPQEPFQVPEADLTEQSSPVSEGPTPPSTETLSPGGKNYVPLNLPDPVILAPGDNEIGSGTKKDGIMLGQAGKAKVPTMNAADPAVLTPSKNIDLETNQDGIVLGKAGKAKVPTMDAADPAVLTPNNNIGMEPNQDGIVPGKAGKAKIPTWNGDPVVPTQGDDKTSSGVNEDSIIRGKAGKAKVPILNLDDEISSEKTQDTVVPGTAGKARIPIRNGNSVEKRQLNLDESEPPKEALIADVATTSPLAAAAMPAAPECVPQGFVSSSAYGRDEFTLGAMSDSTYEYLPKQYLLLGGQVEKYRSMYEQSMDVVKKHLLFRPMLPNGEDILFSGKLYAPSNLDDTTAGDLIAENSHLTCFAGGMFGMGAKLFDRPDDLEVAKKLTEGCVWSYSMTPTGIMPESFEVAPCMDAKDCAWNETAYWEVIDPRYESRMQSYQDQRKIYEERMVSASSWYEAQLAAITPRPTPAVAAPVIEAQETSTLIYADTLDRRQLPDLVDDAEIAHMPSPAPSTGLQQDRGSVMGGEPEEGEGPPTKVQPALNIQEMVPQPSATLPQFPYVYSPAPILDHKDYVQNRITEGRLPNGVTRIGQRNYILR